MTTQSSNVTNRQLRYHLRVLSCYSEVSSCGSRSELPGERRSQALRYQNRNQARQSTSRQLWQAIQARIQAIWKSEGLYN